MSLPRRDGETALRTVAVTAAHALDSISAAECRFVLRERMESGSARREISLPIRKDGKPLWAKHPKHDVAVLPVSLPDGVAMATFSLDQIVPAEGADASAVKVGHEVWVPCFPATLEGNPAGWPVLRRGTIATFPLRPVDSAPTMLIDISAFGGDSGAPVVILTDDGPRVAGLVLGMQRQTDRVSLPFEERTMHTPLGLSIVLQSPLILETVILLP